MLTLQPKVNELIVLHNSNTGHEVAAIKMFITNRGRARLAFDVSKEITVTRKQWSAENDKRQHI